VLAARFRRIISRPAWWGPEDLERTGGPAIDLHIHDADFIQFLFGMPRAVVSAGYVGKGETIEHIDSHYHYGDGRMAVTAEGGWLAQQGCPFEHGYDVYFEEATLKFNSSWGIPPQLLTKDGKTRRPRLPGKDGFVGELQEAVDAVRSGKPSMVIGGDSARNSLALCLKEIQSVHNGRRMTV
jgi:predicted dehydrogenase